FALRGHEQGLVRKPRRLSAERFEHLDLHGAVGHMVLTTHDMRHAEIDIVDHTWEQIQPASILAPRYGVTEQLRVEPLLPSDEIVPYDRRVMVEAEAPVRSAAL